MQIANFAPIVHTVNYVVFAVLVTLKFGQQWRIHFGMRLMELWEQQIQ